MPVFSLHWNLEEVELSAGCSNSVDGHLGESGQAGQKPSFLPPCPFMWAAPKGGGLPASTNLMKKILPRRAWTLGVWLVPDAVTVESVVHVHP